MTGKGTGKTRRWLRSAFRLSLCLLLLPLVTCTILLFTTTGGSVPAAFRSWKDLGCDSPTATFATSPARFLCMSRCGQFYVTENTRTDPRECKINNWSNGKAILTFAPELGVQNQLVVSKDGSLLAVSCDNGLGPEELHIFQSLTGQLAPSFPRGIGCLAFSPDGKSVVFNLNKSVHVESLGPKAHIKTLQLMESRQVVGVYYDSAGRPKALVFQEDNETAGTELWDVLSGERDWRAKNIQGAWESSFISPRRFMASHVNEAGQNGLYSIETGRLLRAKDLVNMDLPMLSADGRFLAYRTVRQGVLDTIERTSLGIKSDDQV